MRNDHPNDKQEHMTSEDKERHAAYHEAGHFVVHYRLLPNFSRDDLSIIPDQRSLGRVFLAQFEDHFIDEQVEDIPLEYREGTVVSIYAGYSAQVKHDPHCRKFAEIGAGSDDEGAHDLLTRYFGLSGHDLGSKKRALRHRADELVKKHWAGIESLAEELLERKELDAEEAETVVDMAEGVGDAAELAPLLAQYRQYIKIRPPIDPKGENGE